MIDTPKATMSEVCRCGGEFLKPEPLGSRCGAEDCAERAYTRANERAEGLAKELEARAGSICKTVRDDKPGSPLCGAVSVAGFCAECLDEHAEMLDKNASPEAAATARVAELERDLTHMDKENRRLNEEVMARGRELAEVNGTLTYATKRNVAERARVAELEKQLADKGRECSDLDGLLKHDHGQLLKANGELARLRALPAPAEGHLPSAQQIPAPAKAQEGT